MIDYREIIRLKSAGYSNSSVASSTGSGRNKDAEVWKRAREKNILQEIAKQYDFDIPETQNERMVYLLFSMMSGSRYTQEDIEELFFLSPSVVYGDLKKAIKYNLIPHGHFVKDNSVFMVSNATYDVTSYATAIVDVPEPLYMQKYHITL
jgi:hypothetical protein